MGVRLPALRLRGELPEADRVTSLCCHGEHKPFTFHCYWGFHAGCQRVLEVTPEDFEDQGGDRVIESAKRQGWILTNTYQYTCPECWERLIR